MLNNIIISGRLTRTPELKSTRDGTAVTSFTVAVDRDYGGENRQTDFIECVAWRQTAEFISRYFNKGSYITVTGSLQSRKYTDRNGNNRTAWEIIVDKAYFCGSKPGAEKHTEPEPDESPDGQSPYFDGRSGADFTELPLEDLPFDL